MTTPIYCAFFGTLKKGHYNHDRFGEGTQLYLRTFAQAGWDMYSLGPYPAICPGDGTVTFELHEVDPVAFRSIRSMERGAGYDERTLKVPLTEDSGASIVEAFVYCWPKARLEGRYDKVEGGDWS